MGASGLLGAAILRRRRSSGAAGLVIVITAVCCGVAAATATSVAVSAEPRADAAEWQLGGGRALEAEAAVVGKIERTTTGWRFDAQLRSLATGAVARVQAVPVVVRISSVPAGLDLGAVVAVSGTAWPADPGQRAVLVIQSTGEPRVLSPPGGVFAAASALRHGLLATTAGLPQPAAGLIAGLAVGDTSDVSVDLDAAMKASSLSHLTAVSGANCALVVGIAFACAALCGARRGLRVVIGLAALAGFVVLVSPEPSVVRAAVMAAIAMLGVLLGRMGAGVSLLSTAVGVILMVDPWQAGSLGFALSVAATGALLLGAGPIADGLSRWMPSALALALSVPLAAQLACGPLLILIAPQVPVYGVLANLLAAPAAPVGTVLGLLACVTAGIPLLGPGVAAIAWLPAAWIAGTADVFARAPGASMPWIEGVPGLVVLALLGAAVVGVIVSGPGRVRAGSAFVVAVGLVLMLALGPIAGMLTRAQVPERWAIAACDVGQGDAVLVRSAGAVALIDTGPDPGRLRACLQLLGVERIDLLVLTHFDLDHRGGVDAVRGRVGTVLHGPPGGIEHQRALDALAAGGARLERAVLGQRGALGDARWRVLWPQRDTLPSNDASVVIDVEGGGVPGALFLGDLSGAGQQAFAARAILRAHYAVIKVAHHGSADQHPALYAATAPTLAVISVGENTYGHPRAETIDFLLDDHARVVRTDQGGTVAVWSEPGALRIWRSEPVGAGG
nr:ComEC/Rec2 family competence protein [Microbacterium sp.]